MIYHKIKNIFFNSNTYIVENKHKKIIVIDPGNPDIQTLISLINKNKWSIEGVFLTHEHADHIAGLPALYNFKKFPVFCSKMTSLNIGNCVNNFSKYIDEIKTFEIDINTQILCDNEFFNVGNMEFFFLETPGHSPGGACFFTSDAVFTGDTILNQMTSPPLNFHHSNRKHYDISLRKFKNQLKHGMTIYPGHGDPFKYNS